VTGEVLAFIDESGQRSKSVKSSDHFIMSAVIIRKESLPKLTALLAELRTDLRRGPNDHLTWKNIRHHGERVHAAQTVGSSDWLRICTVVVCKRFLPTAIINDDYAYLYTFRFLLERLSWFGRQYDCTVSYTLAAIQRFPLAKLREYEAALRLRQDCNVDWAFLDRAGGRIDQPQRYEPLQLGDLAASATAQAFEPDRFGVTERRYLEQLAPRIWGGPYAERRLPSYGLKMHPWNETTKVAYPWVATL